MCCTVPFSSCAKPRPLCAYREMYLAALSASRSKTEPSHFGELIASVRLFQSCSTSQKKRYISKVEPQAQGLFGRFSFPLPLGWWHLVSFAVTTSNI